MANMTVRKEYSATVDEAQCGNEVLFWRAVADAVERMSPLISGCVAVSTHGEIGKRTASLYGQRRARILGDGSEAAI